MKVTVKFTYTEEILPKGCRKLRPMLFNDGVAVFDIKELNSEDAPVAIKSSLRTQLAGCLEGQFRFDYRFYNRQLWTSVRLRGCDPASYRSGHVDFKHPKPEALIDLTVRSASYSHDLNIDHRQSRNEIKKSIKNSLKNIIMIEGVTYKRVLEPMFKVVTFGFGGNHGGTALFADASFNKVLSESGEFNLFDYDLAVKHATLVAQNRGDDKSLPITINGGNVFEILIPEAIQLKYSAKKKSLNKTLKNLN